jgi:hypothetical protein
MAHAPLRHALLSLVSIIVSTLKGVEYILINDQLILCAFIQILVSMHAEQKEVGSVNHRFLMAALQKISIKLDTVPCFIQMQVPDLLIKFVEMQLGTKSPGIHFSLDFGTALLANILHAPSTQQFLKSAPHMV